jgi:hypothetical protein
MTNRLASIEARLQVLTWMIGGVYGVLLVLGAPAILLLLRVASKVGALG